MSITLSALQRQRRDTAANWTAENPTLLAGEIGLESDTGYWKVGDGATAWNALAYVPGLGGEIPVSRLADGAARQLLQTDAAGTGVEWTDNVDVPGTLDVTGAGTFDGNVTIQGDLTVNGTTTTVNSETLLVKDKNIEMGVVATPTDVTADGGGITLKGTTDKTINWVDATDAWTLSEHVDIASGKEYRIDGAKVLDATTLGSAVVSSSLTSVGTIGTGTWQGTTVATGYGGTGQTSYTDGQLLIGKTDGTLAKATITQGSGVTITNGDGTITIAATGSGGTVTAVTATSPLASTGGTAPDISIQDGTTAQKGAVQLEDSTSSTSTTTAATPNAVKSAYDLANAALPASGGTLTGDVTLNAQSDLRFADADSSNWVAFQGPATVASNVTWTLPDADGTSGQVLSTDGAGALSWATAAGGATDKIEEGNTSAEVIDTGSDGRFVVTTEGVEALRVDSSQRVGIGTTSPSHILHLKKSDASDAYCQYENSVATTYFGTGSTGNTFVYNNSAKPIEFYTNATERARIDSSGRLLVGTSSTRTFLSWDTPQVQIEGTGYQQSSLSLYNNENSVNGAVLALGHSRGTSLGSNTVVSNGDYFGAIPFYGSDGSNELRGAEIAAYVDGTPGANDMPGRLVFSTTADGASSPTERCRIDSSGKLLFGVTSTPSASVYGVQIAPAGLVYWTSSASTTGGYTHARFFNPNGEVGSISTSSSATSYNTSSDYRLKENVVPLTGAADRLKQLPVHRFNFIADPDKTVDGFLAHEAQAVVPECVIGTKDAVDDNGDPVYQGIDQSKLVPLLTAALQEAIGEIESLKARVAALESA